MLILVLFNDADIKLTKWNLSIIISAFGNIIFINDIYGAYISITIYLTFILECLEYLEKYHDPTKFDWEAMIIDWECSRYTKEASPRNARQEYEYLMENLPNDDMSKTKKYFLYHYVEPKLKSLGL